MSCYNSRETGIIQDSLQDRKNLLDLSTNNITIIKKALVNAVCTLTIPATNAPQLKAPISLGIEINLPYNFPISRMSQGVKEILHDTMKNSITK